jgi:spore coat protein CotF
MTETHTQHHFQFNKEKTQLNLKQGENTTEFNLNVTTNIITESFSTKTWEYSIQITPNVSNLLSNQFITFDLNMTHTMVSRDSGTAIFNSEHEIIKNNVTPITYTTSPTNTNTVQTQCTITVNEITEVFTESVQSLQYNPTDTSIVGTITQTVIIDGGGADCGLDCRMIGNYTTNLQISNVRLVNGENCQSIGTAGIKTATQQLNTNDCGALP